MKCVYIITSDNPPGTKIGISNRVDVRAKDIAKQIGQPVLVNGRYSEVGPWLPPRRAPC